MNRTSKVLLRVPLGAPKSSGNTVLRQPLILGALGRPTELLECSGSAPLARTRPHRKKG